MTIMVRSMSGRRDGTGAGAESIQPEIQPREREREGAGRKREIGKVMDF